MTRNIKYISYYDIAENKLENRNYVLAATNKMDYIISALNHLGIHVEIVSASGTHNKTICHKKQIKLGENCNLKLPFALGYGNVFRRVLGRMLIHLQILFELVVCTSPDECVVVYHSLGYIKTIALAKKLRKFKLILEVEEIYGDVIGDDTVVQKELKFFKLADAYIFPTAMLNNQINLTNKPHVIVHGTYGVAPKFEPLWQDDKIHCVYAGTFDPRKGGAAAVAAAEFLSGNYHLHIIGFGSEKDKIELLNTITTISKKTDCKITFDGLLSGDEYLQFLQSCHIGLSLQNPAAKFNNTSFPSKVLSYMANGLRVVSIQIPALETSDVADLLYFYQEDSPQAIAKAILAVDLEDGYESRETIKELDDKFREEISKLLESI